MPTLEELLATEQILRTRLEKLIENGRAVEASQKTQGFFETKKADLQRLWERYAATDFAVSSYLLQKDASHEYLKGDYFGESEYKYSAYLSELVEGVRTFQGTIKTASDDSTAQTATASSQDLSLPRISLPKFNGDYDSWRSFHDLFEALVQKNTNLSPVQKLHYLKSCLTGEAEKLLRHTPITGKDYAPAWLKLKERYENKRILVNHQLKVLINQPKLSTESAHALKTLVNTTEDCLQQLQGLELDTKSWDAILIYLVVQKLPFTTLKLWEEELGASQELPTYVQFSTFLDKRLKILESISDTILAKPAFAKPSPKERTQVFHSARKKGCPACHKNHFITSCPKYQSMNIEARLKLIKAAARCVNCLSGNHTSQDCSSQYTCRKCNQRHHTTLHKELQNKYCIATSTKKKSNKLEQVATQSIAQASAIQANTGLRKPSGVEENQTPQLFVNHQGTSQVQATASRDKRALESPPINEVHEFNATQTFLSRETHYALLSTALVIAQSQNGEPHMLRCLIDTGSQSSFITEEACLRLCATRTPTLVNVTGINTSPAATSRHQTTLHLRSRGSNTIVLKEEFLILKEITGHLPTRTVSKVQCEHLQDLQLADPNFWRPGKIDALLGARAYAQIVQQGIRRGANTAPIAIQTTLGWILLGPVADTNINSMSTCAVTTDDSDLSTQLKKFWEIEEIPTKSMLNKEDERCQKLYEATQKRLESGHYQVKLPFREKEGPLLGQSRPQALQRFYNLQRQLARNLELQANYKRCVNEYLELEHMEAVEPPMASEPHYYLPHHAVLKDSTTTNTRVVFDASAKTTNGTSLNDHLLKGPSLQPKLFATLLKWRKHRFAMHADIEKMYRMISIHPEHRTFQRIIWPHPHTNEIQDYQLKTVTFGTSSAPYLAVRTLQQLAEDEKETWPLASKATFTDFYVDDLLTGADSLSEAKELQGELMAMMKAGGFNLRKWASNEPLLLSHLSPELLEVQNSLIFTEDGVIKTLGIRWLPGQDCFTFVITPRQNPSKVTKRTILSEVASLYDPLGWLAPVVIVVKIMMQSLWITGLSWDDPVSEAIQREWTEFKVDLNTLHHLKIPRWIRYQTGEFMQLHGFCDASAKAYAAAIYLRVEDENTNIWSTLLTAKTKVAPTKPTTIPRLELNGAVLLAKLLQTTVEDMQLQTVPMFAWTDSTITLQWIKEHPSRWKTYVANRVVEIQDILKYDRWYHVPTADNPADLASRGTTASNLIKQKLWWHGPAWLIKKADEWPSVKCSDCHTELEAKPSLTAVVIKPEEDILLRYSSYTRLIRIIATIQRFAYNCMHVTSRRLGILTNAEWEQAEISILKLVQKASFPEEHEKITKEKPLANNSRLKKLNPFIDQNGLIRLGGRLNNALLSYNRKHPVIRPQHHHVTQLIIDKIHRETLHGGTSLVLSESRNMYWILNARRCITSNLHKCVVCARHRKVTTSQLMGNLASARVNMTKPFTKVGIDYAGPCTVKVSKHRNAKGHKAYFCIFVCMATRAINIELVSDLTAEAFLAALKRFVARRGLCTDIFSDCGTNFIGGKTILDKELERAVKEATPVAAQYLVTKAITWHFNPPAAPHFGGIWEAGVKSIKHHLRRTLGNSICTFEEYATILAQIEACLNSRPLCQIRNDPEDLFILTPGHFLVGHALHTIPEADPAEGTTTVSQRWRHTQQMSKQFWDKWSRDYLNQLQHRPRWLAPQPNIKVGEVVILKYENMPPTCWPLGIIEQVYPGSDGLVRVVQVRTQNSTFSRPITKICRLPLEDSSL